MYVFYIYCNINAWKLKIRNETTEDRQYEDSGRKRPKQKRYNK